MRSLRRAVAISSPLLEAAIDGARGILLNISGGSDLGLFEVNAAAEVIHGVAHPDANIIFGAVIDDEMGDEVRVTVIAAGFERWDGQRERVRSDRLSVSEDGSPDLFAADDDDLDGQRRRLRRPVVPEVGRKRRTATRKSRLVLERKAGARTAHIVATSVEDGDLAITSPPADLDARRHAVVDLPWTWMQQVHGATVVRVAEPGGEPVSRPTRR